MGYLVRLAFFIGAAALLAGCGGSQAPIGTPGAMPQSRAVLQHGAQTFPQASGSTLLYASDEANGVVVVYSYPKGKLVGTLTGFPADPAGLCSDSNGNVYVTTRGDETSPFESYIYEYAHGGTVPIKTLSDPGMANGCAVDELTGNLAVTNDYGPSGSYGDVAVYAGAQGDPTTYTSPNVASFRWCTYDSGGNLFADGEALEELPQGGGSLQGIQLSKSIALGSIQLVGTGQFVIDSPTTTHGPERIYPVNIAEYYGSVGDPISLSSRNGRAAQGDIQFLVFGNKIVGPGHTEGASGVIQVWRFPRGGLAIKRFKPRRNRDFFGVTISAAPSR